MKTKCSSEARRDRALANGPVPRRTAAWRSLRRTCARRRFATSHETPRRAERDRQSWRCPLRRSRGQVSSAICSGVAVQCATAPRCAQEDLMECQPILGPKPFRIGCEIGRELLVARLCGSHVLGEEFHLLPHAAANDDIVAVEARRPAFAIENLVANVVLDRGLATPARSADAARCERNRRRGWQRVTPK